jgi:hypothetical protein
VLCAVSQSARETVTERESEVWRSVEQCGCGRSPKHKSPHCKAPKSSPCFVAWSGLLWPGGLVAIGRERVNSECGTGWVGAKGGCVAESF